MAKKREHKLFKDCKLQLQKATKSRIKLPDGPATTTPIASTMKWQSKKIKTTLAQY